jgi:HEAT repeat protein
VKKAVLVLFALWAVGCGPPRVEHSVPSLVKTLKNDKDPNMRYWAAESLGNFGPPAREAVPDLIEALKDPEPMVRMGAAYALGEIGPTPEAVATLKQALKDPDQKVREGAAYALRKKPRKR